MIRACADAVSYQGLDIKKMKTTISKSAGAPNNQLLVAVILGLKRGNNIDRMLITVRKDMKERIQALAKDLNLKSRVNKEPEAVTLTRVLLCFPELTALVAKVIKPAGVVPDTDQDYPYAMRNGSFSSLIPRRARVGRPNNLNIISALTKSHNVYQARTSMQLDKKLKQIDKDVLNRQRTFVHTGIVNGVLSDERRYYLLENFGLDIINNGVINNSVVAEAANYDRVSAGGIL